MLVNNPRQINYTRRLYTLSQPKSVQYYGLGDTVHVTYTRLCCNASNIRTSSNMVIEIQFYSIKYNVYLELSASTVFNNKRERRQSLAHGNVLCKKEYQRIRFRCLPFRWLPIWIPIGIKGKMNTE